MTRDVINSGVMGATLGGMSSATWSAIVVGCILAVAFALTVNSVKESSH